MPASRLRLGRLARRRRRRPPTFLTPRDTAWLPGEFSMSGSVRSLLALAAVLGGAVPSPGDEGAAAQGVRKQAVPPQANYRQAALDAARWIRSTKLCTERGTAWPTDPNDPKSVNTSLYSGVPGVVLFFLEAYRTTGEDSYRQDARAGAEFLLAELAGVKETGLYTGLSGIGFTLLETFKVTREEKYRQGAKRCLGLLKERARKAGRGVEWNGAS